MNLMMLAKERHAMTNAILRGKPDVKQFASAKTRSLLHGLNSTLGSVAFLLSLFCVWSSHAAETNVWTGAGGDLKWGNAANWSKSDMTKSYVWDFRALPAGTVTFDFPVIDVTATAVGVRICAGLILIVQ